MLNTFYPLFDCLLIACTVFIVQTTGAEVSSSSASSDTIFQMGERGIDFSALSEVSSSRVADRDDDPVARTLSFGKATLFSSTKDSFLPIIE